MAETLSAQKTVKFIVTRQESPDSKPYTEEFEIPYRSNMNVISGLMEVQRNPKNAKGDKTTPVCWESNCLEEVCGACSMVSTVSRVKLVRHLLISWSSRFGLLR